MVSAAQYPPEKRCRRTVYGRASVAGDKQQAVENLESAWRFYLRGFPEFLEPKGYYSPIKSFQVRTAHVPTDASGVVVTVELSAYPTRSPRNDAIKTAQSREVEIWVERSDNSMSFPPP